MADSTENGYNKKQGRSSLHIIYPDLTGYPD